MRTDKVTTSSRRLIRIFLLMALTASTMIAGVAFFIYQEEIKNHRQNIAIEQAHRLDNQTMLIRENFRHSAHALLFLVNQIQLHQPFKTRAGLKALANDFISFLDSDKLYDQVRLLDIHGMEVLSARYQAGKPGIVPESELQLRNRRDYFVKTILLSANMVYISPMVLATERGRVVRPVKPVIQFGMPVFNRRGRKIGMILMNYLTGNLLAQFRKAAELGMVADESMLLNHDGYWLSAPVPYNEWGFMFKTRSQRRFGVTAPEAWRRIARQQSGHFFVDGDQYRFTTIYPTETISSVSRISTYRNPRQAFWKLVSRYPQTAFTAATVETRNTIVFSAASFMLLINGIFWMLARAMVRRQQAEEELEKLHMLEKERASRLALLGRMSAEVAHELHQPLSAILSYADTCLRLLKTGEMQTEKLIRILGKLSGQADRAGHVVRHVGNFTRNHEMKRVSLDLNILINETLDLAELETRKYRVKTGTSLARPLPPVFADRLLIQQVMLNLIRNACEAMEGIEPRKRRLMIGTDKADNNYVKVSVHDQGPGPAPDELEHMFDAFFSLKNEGMGLGLSVSRSIIENHEGRLWAERIPESGMVVCFTLPVTEALRHEG